MTRNPFSLAAWRRGLLFEAADNPGAGANTAPAAGTDPIPGASADTAPAAGTDPIPAAGAKASAASWWEDKRFDQGTQTQLKALGLTVDDPLDAVVKLTAMERAAKQKLGKGADALMDRPAEGQDVTEWLRQNGDMLGIPENSDSYEVKRPEGWPKDAPWDDKLEAAAREAGHALGLSQTQMQGMTEVFAARMAETLSDAETGAAAAEAALMDGLKRDWGDQTAAKVAQAQQAASVVAEAAGLDGDAVQALTALLSNKMGDAYTVRMFAAIGAMMGEDSLTGGNALGTALSTTPADARAQLEAMKSPGSDYMKAQAAQRDGKQSDFKRLHAQFMELTKLAAG